MAANLKLVLDTYRISMFDYGNDVNFKLYDEDLNAFDASTYTTAVVKTFKRPGDRALFFRDVAKAITLIRNVAQIVEDRTVTWTTQASGEGKFTYSQSQRPAVAGYSWIQVQLEKSGAKLSSELVRIFVEPSRD